MVGLGSRGTGIENKGFFSSRVRKFAKMAVFAFGHSNSYKRLEIKEKVAFSDDLCLVVGMDRQCPNYLFSKNLINS